MKKKLISIRWNSIPVPSSDIIIDKILFVLGRAYFNNHVLFGRKHNFLSSLFIWSESLATKWIFWIKEKSPFLPQMFSHMLLLCEVTYLSFHIKAWMNCFRCYTSPYLRSFSPRFPHHQTLSFIRVVLRATIQSYTHHCIVSRDFTNVINLK